MRQSLNWLLLALLVSICTGCASAQTAPQEPNPDPLEPINRLIFSFNDNLDRYVAAPLARGYRWITPGFLERGIRNVIANLYDANGVFNAVLQARFPEAARDTGRFVVNSTVGMLGFVDVASEMGIPPYRTDFGHTLAIWGFGSGPYIMVPFLGPRTVRSGTGFMVDTVASVQWQLDATTRNTLFALEVIDTRAALIGADELITGDRYIFIRDAYLQQREYFVNDGVVDDAFSDGDDDFDWDE
jgi:phospholipid-binding lipoprotein MlaA